MNRKLLIVDDEEAILFSLKIGFAKFGFDVDCAEESEEAEALLAHNIYLAVIADLNLTGTQVMEGLEFVRYAREISPTTRILIMTAFGTQEVKTEALKRGADKFLHKPQSLSAVTQIVMEMLGE